MSHSLLTEQFSSPLGMTHVITHTRNTLNPEVVVIDNATNEYLVATVTVLSPFQIQIDLFVARSVRGTIS